MVNGYGDLGKGLISSLRLFSIGLIGIGILLGIIGHMFLGWLFAHLSIGWQ